MKELAEIAKPLETSVSSSSMQWTDEEAAELEGCLENSENSLQYPHFLGA